MTLLILNHQPVVAVNLRRCGLGIKVDLAALDVVALTIDRHPKLAALSSFPFG